MLKLKGNSKLWKTYFRRRDSCRMYTITILIIISISKDIFQTWGQWKDVCQTGPRLPPRILLVFPVNPSSLSLLLLSFAIEPSKNVLYWLINYLVVIPYFIRHLNMVVTSKC